jgi:hypothetical protein
VPDLLRLARSAKHQVVTYAGVAAERVAQPLRRGRRSVVMTPEYGMRLGNFLYLWMRADLLTAQGQDVRTLGAPAMEPWLAVFPGLVRLTLPRPQLRFTDRRDPNNAYLHQRFGIDFSALDLDRFIRTYLAPHVTPRRDDTMVVNVRRGDYYSHAPFRAKFEFDQVGYVREALRRAGRLTRVVVVSDDPAWCRDELDALLREHGADPTYAEPDAVSNFLEVAGASRIIGTNSTFTYWAAYVSGALHHEPQIIMPLFHARMAQGSDAFQLDPRWTAVPGFH